MSSPRSIQDFVHWLEAGEGARRVRLAAVLLGIAALSLLIVWKQFRGPADEQTLVQADMGRQLAEGKGFTTLVNYPQTAAYLRARGREFSPTQAYPELHHAPLYPLAIAGSLRVLPDSWRQSLYEHRPVPPGGYAADYYLLGLNLVFLWLAAWQTQALARALFGERAGTVAALGLLFSAALWKQVVSLDGTLLLAVLMLAAFQLLVRLEEASEEEERPSPLLPAALGAVCGLLFLTDYSAGLLLPLVLGYLWYRTSGRRRLWALSLVSSVALAVAAPWLVRNSQVAGNPLGLAWQQLALKADDQTADPALWRASYTTEAPAFSINKIANKALTQVQESLSSRLWSGGSLFFAAFFVAGALYRFRSSAADRLRWLFLLAFVTLLVGQAACSSGENPRLPVYYLSPLVIVFGTGFFFVLAASSSFVSSWPRLAAAALLSLQALPLVHDALEPRRIHFHYPPYFPTLFAGLREELERRAPDGRYGVMADVPAGVAWYGRQRTWAQPPVLKDFYAISVEQPIAELLLTPRTLDRPFFSELSARPVLPSALLSGSARFGEWGQVYASLFTGRPPQNFPLRSNVKLADNLYVLVDPSLPLVREK